MARTIFSRPVEGLKSGAAKFNPKQAQGQSPASKMRSDNKPKKKEKSSGAQEAKLATRLMQEMKYYGFLAWYTVIPGDEYPEGIEEKARTKSGHLVAAARDMSPEAVRARIEEKKKAVEEQMRRLPTQEIRFKVQPDPSNGVLTHRHPLLNGHLRKDYRNYIREECMREPHNETGWNVDRIAQWYWRDVQRQYNNPATRRVMGKKDYVAFFREAVLLHRLMMVDKTEGLVRTKIKRTQDGGFEYIPHNPEETDQDEEWREVVDCLSTPVTICTHYRAGVKHDAGDPGITYEYTLHDWKKLVSKQTWHKDPYLMSNLFATKALPSGPAK